MIIKMLRIAIVIVLTVGLIGCINKPNEPEFPTGFTRVADGAHIYLGMHRDDAEKILGEPTLAGNDALRYEFGENETILLAYNADDKKIFYIDIRATTNRWTILDGIYVGMDRQTALDIVEYSGLPNLYDVNDRAFHWKIIDNPRTPVYVLQIMGDGRDKANWMVLSRPKLGFWEIYGYPR